MPLRPAIARYDHVLLDLDGCLWIGDDAVEGAPEAVAALREAGKGIAFLTNDVRHAPDHFVRKLWRLGYQASLAEVVTVGAALQFSLAERPPGGSAFVIGSQALVDHVADAGLRIVNNTEFATRADVVVAGGHEDFDYRELRIATQAVLRGAELIGVTRDRTFPMPDGPWPASGPGARRRRGGDRPARRAHGRQARARDVRHRARPARRRAATWRRATGSTSTSPARAAQGSTARSCSAARRAARRPTPPSRGRRTWPSRSRASCCG